MADTQQTMVREGARAMLSEEDRKRLERLRPIDDDFMRMLYRDNTPLTEETLRIVAGLDVHVVKQETQRDLKRLAGARSVELDVWAKDARGRWYDIEVQRGSKARPKRARYYSAAMDVEALDKNKEPETLPDQWVIFIMEKDPFGDGAGTYLFRRTQVPDGRVLADGAQVLYVNGAYRGDDELGRLMHDFNESDPDAMLNAMMAERVRYFKRTSKGEANMCEVFDEIRQEGRAEGHAEGHAEGLEEGRAEGREEGVEEGIGIGEERMRLENLRILMAQLGISAQKAVDLLKVPEAEQPHYLAML